MINSISDSNTIALVLGVLLFIVLIAAGIMGLFLGIKINSLSACLLDKDMCRVDLRAAVKLLSQCESNSAVCARELAACLASSNPLEPPTTTLEICQNMFTPTTMCTGAVEQKIPEQFHAALINRTGRGEGEYQSYFLSRETRESGEDMPVGVGRTQEMFFTRADSETGTYFISYESTGSYLINDGNRVIIRNNFITQETETAKWHVSFIDSMTRVQSALDMRVLVMNSETHAVSTGFEVWSPEAQWIITPTPTPGLAYKEIF
jgi:hypothetical protein